MYSYTYDMETGGILLNSSPTVFSKEPRPVYSSEMDILGFDRFYKYERQDDIPYMWAESATYWYRGVRIAKVKGGNLYEAPELIPERDENGDVLFGKAAGKKLEKIDLVSMCKKNIELMSVIEDVTVKRIVKEYEKFRKKLDIFHVAYSGGKDSAVLLDLVKKALPRDSFVVIFGDTGMEFPDTYAVVEKTKQQCEEDGTPFYVAKSHLDPKDSWYMFGPPARVLRWCCSVHKSAPQTIKLREITGKNNYVGMDFVGVRAQESVTRSKYDYENFGKKQKGQYSFNPIRIRKKTGLFLSAGSGFSGDGDRFLRLNIACPRALLKDGMERLKRGVESLWTTLCYIEQDGKYLMLHRTKKKKDINKDKWIGVGGHAEEGEGPEECLLREVKEETGLTLTSYRFRGLITFISNECEPELMCLFTADGFTGELITCNEGDLVWVDKTQVPELPTWSGDAIFLKQILSDDPRFFTLRLVYVDDTLVEHRLQFY